MGNLLQSSTMRFFAFLLCASFASAALVKREAEAAADPVADPEAEPVYGLNASGGYAEPVCTFTPVKTCKPRQISTPRKVCQTVLDLYEDVVVTEKCREVVTTTCTQTTQTASHTSAVVDTSTNLVQAGVPKPPVRRRREAEAEADAEAKPEAEADADAHYGAVIAPVAVVAAPIVTTHEPVKSAGYPVCNSVPEKTCERIPTSTPRNVARTVCDTVVDVTTIEDRTETVTKHCQHTSSSTSSSSKVVGQHSVVPAVPTNVIG